ncbi:MAG: hypothetical protein OXG62_11270 [Nitrospinae bacterium]|nr:hypothetical protein [Nitrospinota bacterium]
MGHRFMYQNLIDEETAIAATSVEKGFVGAGVPRVTGAGGSMIFSGAYAGEDPEVYSAEIDAPGDVGIARFKWRKTSTPAGGWEASNIPTSLTDIALDSGVKIRFAGGADSPAFALGDHWQATANRFYSPKRLYDLDPATRLRSNSPPEDPWSLALDFYAEKSPDVFIAHLHNFSPGASLRIQANSSADWRAPALDERLAWRNGTLIHYLSTSPRSYRHWRLLAEGGAAGLDAYLEISEMYLGGYFEPADHFWFGNVVGEESFEEGGRTENMAEHPVLLNRGRTVTLPYERISDEQRGEFLTMYRAVKNVETRRAKPFFVHMDVDDPASIILAHFTGGFLPRQMGPDDFSFELVLKERLA